MMLPSASMCGAPLAMHLATTPLAIPAEAISVTPMNTEQTMPMTHAGVNESAASKAIPETIAPTMPPSAVAEIAMPVSLPTSRRPYSCAIMMDGPIVAVQVPMP